jgi:hypothetical protein
MERSSVPPTHREQERYVRIHLLDRDAVARYLLDPARRPSWGVADDQLPDAIRVLLAASDDCRLTELAVQQRKQAALRRACVVVRNGVGAP